MILVIDRNVDGAMMPTVNRGMTRTVVLAKILATDGPTIELEYLISDLLSTYVYP
ncbi:Hypothetical protein MVR_LOCUS39 [uncultured virus]|nr:Hypothetical protein MVR_LOCUS39 [uncultured virus]